MSHLAPDFDKLTIEMNGECFLGGAGPYCACARLQGESGFNYFKSRCRTASMNTKLREGSSLYCSFLHKTRNYAVPCAIFDSPTPIIGKAKNMQTCGKNTRNTESSHAAQEKKKWGRSDGFMD